MSKILYVYSTLASDVDYTLYAEGGGDLPIALPPVRIQGGAGVANDRLVTPRGVVTRVTEEQAAQLRQNKVFELHEKNGYITISETSADPDTVAADLTGRDYSAPIVPGDLPDDEQPTMGTPDEPRATDGTPAGSNQTGSRRRNR